jgi:hypothetical protein
MPICGELRKKNRSNSSPQNDALGADHNSGEAANEATRNNTNAPTLADYWKRHDRLDKAITEVKENESSHLIAVAFDMNAKFQKTYVTTTKEEAFRACLGGSPPRIGFQHNADCQYEVLHDSLGNMRLYYDAEYATDFNLDKNPQDLKNALHYYIQRAYEAIFAEAGIAAPPLVIHVETCHRAEKVSFHGKIAKECGVVQSMSDQRKFWAKVLSLITNDLEDGANEENRERAQLLQVKKKDAQIDWFIDLKVYCMKAQLMRMLGACMFHFTVLHCTLDFNISLVKANTLLGRVDTIWFRKEN